MTQAHQIILPAVSLEEAEKLAVAIDQLTNVDALAVTISEVDEGRRLWETAAYFTTEAEASEALALLGVAGDIRMIPDLDWVSKSLAGLSPVKAGRFFLHGSHDRSARRYGGISLEIDAGTAFGTGHHPTTAGCLLALHDILKLRRPQCVLDLGCGTGVLAIAAAKAVKRGVLATDIDPEAANVTRRNASLNAVGPLVQPIAASGIHNRTIHLRAPYDVIFANILARPLTLLAQGLTGLLMPGGVVILSGLTRDQIQWVSASYRSRGLTTHKRVIIGNWATLVFTKPGKAKRPDRFRAGRSISRVQAPGWKTDGL
jgi:ribosomal protein L11 methyltransferase